MEEIKDYHHNSLNQEVQAIGGRYVLTAENRIIHDGREILYRTGYALFDSTCCGSGGCTYAVVDGIIVSWRQKKDTEGGDISEIAPLRDEKTKNEIRQIIMDKERISQVVFL